jgi:hypothetical protein
VFGAVWFIVYTASLNAASIDEVIVGVKALEVAIPRLALDSTTTTTPRAAHDGGDVFQIRATQAVVIEFNGRARAEGQTDDVYRKGDKEIRRRLKFRCAFDGAACRFERGEGSPSEGFVTSQRSDLPWAFDFREMVTHYLRAPVSDLIKEGNGRIVSEAQYDGHTVLVVETDTVERELHWRKRFLIDPQLGFAVVKRSQLVRFPPHDTWIEFTWVEGHDYSEVATGVWLPGRVLHESTDPTAKNAEEGSEAPMAWRVELQNTHWVVNPIADDESFRIDFSPGVLVEDKVNGRAYQVAGLSDGMIDQQTGNAAGIDGPQGKSSRRAWGLSRVLVVGNIVLVAILSVCVYWKLHRRR